MPAEMGKQLEQLNEEQKLEQKDTAKDVKAQGAKAVPAATAAPPKA